MVTIVGVDPDPGLNIITIVSIARDIVRQMMEVPMRHTEATRSTGPSVTAVQAVTRAVALSVRPLWLMADSLFIVYERTKQRRALQRLDDHLLKDIGLSRSEVENEVTKPFWRG